MPVWHLAFVIALLMATAIALGQGLTPWRAVAVLALALLLLGLYAVTVSRQRRWWERAASPGYMLGVAGVYGGLILLHPVYALVFVTLIPQLFMYLRGRWAVLTLIALYVLALSRTELLGAGFDWSNPQLLLNAFTSTAFTVMICLFIGHVIRQSEERQKLIEALEKTRRELAEAERQAGILEERQRLSRDIHDTLAQGFASIVMHLEAAKTAPEPEKHLRQAQETARESLLEARSLVWALRPEALLSSLPEALARVSRRWSEGAGIPVSFTVTGAADALHPELEVTLLRALQEALANVRKHAHAKEVSVTLSYVEDTVILDVHDDGQGLPDEPARPTPAGGLGLEAMRERAARLSGTVALESVAGEGTTLTVMLPLGAS